MSLFTRNEIENAIKQILIIELAVDPSLVATSTAATRLVGEGLTLDSVETVGLAISLEKTFNIQIGDDELVVETFESLGQVIDYVAGKIGLPTP